MGEPMAGKDCEGEEGGGEGGEEERESCPGTVCEKSKLT